VAIYSLQERVIEHLEGAWGFFRKYRDHELSFTDCTSFAAMRKYGIREAFTFDEDFSKAGFEIVPRRKP